MEEENTQQRPSAAEKAAEVEEAYRKGEEKVKELEKDPPKNLEDWPDDHAKYVTFGGPDGSHSYEEGPESKLGPSGLRHHAGRQHRDRRREGRRPLEVQGRPDPGRPDRSGANASNEA